MDCYEEDEIVYDRVHCPTCKRDFVMIKRHHICDVSTPCGAPSYTYLEKYLDTPREDPNIKIKETKCAHCTFIELKRTMPRRGKCKGCQFEGLFVYADDNMLCPSCVVQSEKKTKQRRPAPTTQQQNAVLAPSNAPNIKPTLYIQCSVDVTGPDAASGVCNKIKLVGVVLPPAGNPAPSWAILNTEWDIVDANYAQTAAEIASALRELSDRYKFSWSTKDMISLCWFKYIYAFAPEGAQYV